MHILLISRHYPPEISGGARRPFLMVNALRALGHQVTLVTPFLQEDTHAICVPSTAINNAMKAEHSSNPPSSSTSFLAKVRQFFRTLLLWPDPDIRWARSVVRAVKVKNIRPDWILTTSPPESVHIVGAHLAKIMGVPWIAELRDTWVENPHREILERSKLRGFIERRIAKSTLSTANAITSVSEPVMSEARKYVRQGTPECIISHFSDPPKTPHTFDSKHLNLVHTGAMTLSDRNRHLVPLLKALQPVYAQRPELILHIAGDLTAKEIKIAENASIPVQLHGPVSLPNARALQAGADGLVLYTSPNSHALPGKYAEYIMAKRPILYYGSGDWLDLVEDKIRIRPLVNGAINLKKDEIVPAQGLSAKSAAQSLVTFLSTVQERSVK